MNLNQTDIDVRLQLAGQAFSEMSSTLASSLSYGRNCIEKQICELNRLSVYISILENYSTLYGVSGLIGQISLYNVCNTASLNISIDGVSISGDVNLTSSNESIQASLLASSINSYQSVYTAEVDPGSITVNLYYTGDYNLELSSVVTGSCEVPVSVVLTDYTLTQLVDGDQCYTEAEIQLICEKISKITGIDFMPIGYNYIP